MKDRIHFLNSFISLKVFCESIYLKTHKKVVDNLTLKPSIRSFFSKMGSKKSLLRKLLMDYTSSIAPFTSNIIVRALNVSNSSTSASSNSIQAET